MNKKALYVALAYALVIISFKLFILLGGFYLSRFGFYYSNAVSVLAIIPFYIIAIRLVRADNGGVIAGREAIRVALTVFAIGAILISLYNYFEFLLQGKQLALEYYNSADFLHFLQKQTKIKPEDYHKIIQEQIAQSEVSAFKATTGKLISMMVIGLSSSFLCAVIMKRSKPN